MKKFIARKRSALAKRETGIALFMVISALALMSILIAELTYTTQINVRMSYNAVDNLKCYYTAKAGLKLSLLRLKAYMAVDQFVNDKKNAVAKQAIGKDIVDKIWSFPFVFPIPVLPDADLAQKEAIQKFSKDSGLSGSYTANISSESSRINLNNLMIKEAVINKNETSGAQPGSSAAKPSQPQQSGTETKAVDFRPMIQKTIESALEAKKEEDQAFSDQYKYVLAADIVNALEAYLFKDMPSSNLPGFKPFPPKEAPFYSITELHLIPGIDDEIYSLLTGLFTVNATPGINVNAAGMPLFRAFFPDAVKEDLERLIRKRDDPDVGKLWESEEDFWKSADEAGLGRGVNAAKDLLQKANIKIITSEQAFRITVSASQGLSSKVLEAFVVIDPNAAKKPSATPPKAGSQVPQAGTAAAGQTASNGQPTQDNSSAKKTTGLNLIYWRML